MFLIKAGTTIQISAPFGIPNSKSTVVKDGVSYTDNQPWKPYVTTEDKLYDVEDVFDAVALHNRPDDCPLWITRNIQLGKTVIRRDGKWALVKPVDISYLD